MCAKKEYLFIAGDNKIYLNKDKEDNLTSINVWGKVYSKTEDLQGLKKHEETYKDSTAPLLDYAKGEMVTAYKEYFKQNFENFLMLSGAGTSKGIGKDKKGVLISDLWNLVQKKFEKGEFEKICEEVKYNQEDKNIENLLSRIQLYQEIKNSITFELDGEDKKLDLKNIVSQIELTIKDHCTLNLPESSPQK